jgi:hypothetical protein
MRMILLACVFFLAACVPLESKPIHVRAYANTMGVEVNGKDIYERVDIILQPGKSVVLSIPGKDQWGREYVWEISGTNTIRCVNLGKDVKLIGIPRETYEAKTLEQIKVKN